MTLAAKNFELIINAKTYGLLTANGWHKTLHDFNLLKTMFRVWSCHQLYHYGDVYYMTI